VLSEAAIQARVDRFLGLKENVIVGQPIPAGTGLRRYSSMLIQSDVGDIFGRANRTFVEEQIETNPEYDSGSELVKGSYYIEDEESEYIPGEDAQLEDIDIDEIEE